MGKEIEGLQKGVVYDEICRTRGGVKLSRGAQITGRKERTTAEGSGTSSGKVQRDRKSEKGTST